MADVKHSVRRFKSLAVALKELEPFVRNGAHLQTGKPFERFGGLRSRELLANWLLCAVMTASDQGEFYFTTDPLGGDGMICDARTDETWPTEHVMVPELAEVAGKALEDRILEQIRLKVDKGGEAYARGKTLLVFLNAAGRPWYPNRVVRGLPEPLHFDTVWAMGLQGIENGEYIYGVTNLHRSGANAPAWRVRITPDFSSWVVERIQ
jgi:hypothetical protein